MANLYATIGYDHRAGHVHRTASRWISTTAETWGAIVTVDLDRGGNCEVTLTDKNGNNSQALWRGNANKAAKERGGAGFAENRTPREGLAYCSRCDCTTTHEGGECLECRREARRDDAEMELVAKASAARTDRQTLDEISERMEGRS